ncbi:MAG: hypothetical protein IKB34_02910 [Clostridia bacterium]|nr:hypothetical protein [Clostridia bacterium]
MKKKISVLLVCLMLLSVLLTACADRDSGDDFVPDVGGATGTFDSLPEYNFKGESIDFLANVSKYTNARNCFEDEELAAGTIERAVYERNERVSAAFNVTFTESYEADVASTTQVIDTLIASNDDSFDIICLPARYMLDVASRNYLYSYDELYNINLHGDAWIQWVNKIIMINDVNFFAFSDAMLSLYDFTHMMLFNTEVLERYQLTSPYVYVNDGDWTYEIMYTMMRKVSSDLNGDGFYGPDDMYGYVCPAYSVLPNYWISAGATTVNKIPKGYFVFELQSDVHFANVWQEIFRMFSGTNVWYHGSPDENRYYDQDKTFQTNHALFADHTFYSISQLREMESDFGIVPYPKWDVSQEQYYSRVEAGTKTWGVLYIQDPELTGTIIEALSLEAHEHLLHTYYDITLQLKLTRDDESIEMLDLIRDTMTYDPGDTLFCDPIRNGIFSGVFKNGRSDLASLLASQSGAVQSKIQEINNYFKAF